MVLLIIVFAIPLTVYVAQQSADIRQKAAESVPYYGGTQTVACGEVVADLVKGSKEGVLTYRPPVSINNEWFTKKLDGTTFSQEDIRNKMRNSHFYSGSDVEYEVTRLVPNPDPTSPDYHPETITCRLYFDYDTADCRVKFVDPSQAGKSNENWLYVGDQPKDIQLQIEENTGGTSPGQCELEIHMHTPVIGTTLTPTGAVTPTNTPTPTTPAGRVTPTGATTTPTNTPTPTSTTSLTPTPTLPSTPTFISVSMTLPGIGAKGNASPNNMQRRVFVQLFDAANKTVGASVVASLSFDQGSGSFKGTANFGTVVPTGNYSAKLKTDQYLVKKTPAGVVTAGTSNTLVPVILISGDINNDNKLDILDYNILVSCFGSKINSDGCGGKKVDADLNDDGVIDGIDYNLFIGGLKIAKQGE